MTKSLCTIQVSCYCCWFKQFQVSNVQELRKQPPPTLTNMHFLGYSKSNRTETEIITACCTALVMQSVDREWEMWRHSPHAQQDLKEDQILSVQYRHDDEEDGDQKAEEEHHGLDDHACREEIRALWPQRLHPVQHPTDLHCTPLHPHITVEGWAIIIIEQEQILRSIHSWTTNKTLKYSKLSLCWWYTHKETHTDTKWFVTW